MADEQRKFVPVKLREPMRDSRRIEVPAGGIAWLTPSAARAVISSRRGEKIRGEDVPSGPQVQVGPEFKRQPTNDRPTPPQKRRTTEGGRTRERTDVAYEAEPPAGPSPLTAEQLAQKDRNEALAIIRACDSEQMLARWFADLQAKRLSGYTILCKAIEDRHEALEKARE